jgi:hypothetical protein
MVSARRTPSSACVCGTRGAALRLVALALAQTMCVAEWQTNTDRVTAILKSLPALPKPHFSRPFGMHPDDDHGPYRPSERAMFTEFARVTRSLPLSPGCSEAAAKAAVSIATDANVSINLYWSPWQDPERWKHGRE